jgi:hypothetical protein
MYRTNTIQYILQTQTFYVRRDIFMQIIVFCEAALMLEPLHFRAVISGGGGFALYSGLYVNTAISRRVCTNKD